MISTLLFFYNIFHNEKKKKNYTSITLIIDNEIKKEKERKLDND